MKLDHPQVASLPHDSQPFFGRKFGFAALEFERIGAVDTVERTAMSDLCDQREWCWNMVVQFRFFHCHVHAHSKSACTTQASITPTLHHYATFCYSIHLCSAAFCKNSMTSLSTPGCWYRV